jgi:hypothetical protein
MMSAVVSDEIRLGLVIHLDTDILRELGGCETNAEQSDIEDRAVHGPHYFLVVEVHDQLEVCTAVPLFSQSAPGSERLQEPLKAGYPDKWIGDDSYFSRWQHWRIPLRHVEAASATDEADRQNRRTYAESKPDELGRILTWQDKNRNGFGPV